MAMEYSEDQTELSTKVSGSKTLSTAMELRPGLMALATKAPTLME